MREGCAIVALGWFNLNVGFRLYDECLIVYFVLEFWEWGVLIAFDHLSVRSNARSMDRNVASSSYHRYLP